MKAADCTVIYYTSNRENEAFEKKIQSILLKMCGDFPIISVSQKPIELGENICVGNVGASDHNLYRQIQIALQAAKTPFVISAEADNLYPFDYFNLEPGKLDEIYRYNNIWLLKYWRTVFVRKEWCEGAQIAGREYYLSLVNAELEGKPMWINQAHTRTNPFRNLNRSWMWYGTEVPVISIKTGRGMRINAGTIGQRASYLPYWGTVKIVKRKLGM